MIVRSTIGKLDKLDEKIQYRFKWNVANFTTYISALLVTLEENGGKEDMVLDKLYELLTHSPCVLFNSEIIV